MQRCREGGGEGNREELQIDSIHRDVLFFRHPLKEEQPSPSAESCLLNAADSGAFIGGPSIRGIVGTRQYFIGQTMSESLNAFPWRLDDSSRPGLFRIPQHTKWSHFCKILAGTNYDHLSCSLEDGLIIYLSWEAINRSRKKVDVWASLLEGRLW